MIVGGNKTLNVKVTNSGAQGGYRLARTPDRYTVGEILRLTEGSLSPVSCVDQDPILCSRGRGCPTLPIWRGLAKAINDYLDGITLQDMADDYERLKAQEDITNESIHG